MSRPLALLLLLACAVLEAGGDALARKGMHAESATARIGFYAMAAVVLFCYGWLVNRPPWSFGKLLGVYVVLFFVVAQIISKVNDHTNPTPGIWLGGALICIGGFVVYSWG